MNASNNTRQKIVSSKPIPPPRLCDNCESSSDIKYEVEILFNQYKFCSLWCAQECETDIRRSWRQTNPISTNNYYGKETSNSTDAKTGS